MSAVQNLSYSVIQVVHNLGAVVTVGGALVATRVHDVGLRRRFAHGVLGGWLTQVASGGAFGATSYYFYHQFPDISGVAIYALGVKMLCAALGILLMLLYIWRNARWTDAARQRVWVAASLLALTAISSAAFLRWFA